MSQTSQVPHVRSLRATSPFATPIQTASLGAWAAGQYHRQMSSVAAVDYEYEVDHLVIGAGVVGLAIAERLAARGGGGSTLLVDKNAAAGQETRYRLDSSHGLQHKLDCIDG